MAADWFCACGTRLSYGVYCKRCQEETDFAWRPLSDLERMIETVWQVPSPYEVPRFADD